MARTELKKCLRCRIGPILNSDLSRRCKIDIGVGAWLFWRFRFNAHRRLIIIILIVLLILIIIVILILILPARSHPSPFARLAIFYPLFSILYFGAAARPAPGSPLPNPLTGTIIVSWTHDAPPTSRRSCQVFPPDSHLSGF